MDEIDQLIVYLCLTLGWTFEYACDFVKNQDVKKLQTFVKELQYQKSVEDYRYASNFAMALSVWANSLKKGNHYKVSDFIGQPPQREGYKPKLKRIAEVEGIKMPKE